MFNFSRARFVNTHWVTYFKACSPCSMKYSYVSKQETSMADANFILAQTHLGKFLR